MPRPVLGFRFQLLEWLVLYICGHDLGSTLESIARLYGIARYNSHQRQLIPNTRPCKNASNGADEAMIPKMGVELGFHGVQGLGGWQIYYCFGSRCARPLSLHEDLVASVPKEAD